MYTKDGQIYFALEQEESRRCKREGSRVALQHKTFHFLVSHIDPLPMDWLDPRKMIHFNKDSHHVNVNRYF